MPVPTRIVCLGGGWVAVFLTRRLRRAIRQGRVDLTVVSRDNYQTFHGFIPEMLTGRIQPQQIISAARRVFPPAQFHNAEIEAVDLQRRRVVTSRAFDGRQYELPYDHLVVAVGSVDDLSRYRGVAEHTLRLKTYWDCFKARSHVLSMLEMAEIEPDPVERRRLLTFVVVGGNYGGVEVAAEFVDCFRDLARREYRGLRPEEIRVVLVHSGDRILPELSERHPSLVDYAHRFLADQGVEFRLNSRIMAATPEEAILTGGERISTRTILSCAGTALSPLLLSLPLEKDDRGRLLVESCGRVVGTEDIWAAGDCAAMPHPHGGTCPPVAVYAMMGGRHVGASILRHLAGKPPRRFGFTGLGEGCSLGRRRAVAQMRGIPFKGVLGWMLWRFTFLSFVPARERRVRILFDWLLTSVFGRDIVNVAAHEPYGVRKEAYEPLQEIVRQGDVGRRLFIVSKGEVEVVRRDETGQEEILAVLGPGQHFGEIAVFGNSRRTATIRARTAVELISLGKDEAVVLSTVAKPFGEHIRRLPTEVPAQIVAPVPPQPE